MEQEPLKPWEVAAREKQAKASTEGKKPWEIAAEQKKAAATQPPPPPGKPQAPPASQGGAGAPSTTAVTPQELSLPSYLRDTPQAAPQTAPKIPLAPPSRIPTLETDPEAFNLVVDQVMKVDQAPVDLDATVASPERPFTKQQIAQAGPGQREAARKREEYNIFFSTTDQEFDRFQKEQLPIKQQLLAQANAGLSADARQFQESVNALAQMQAGLEAMRGTDPAAYEQGVREYEQERQRLLKMQSDLQLQGSQAEAMASDLQRQEELNRLRDYEIKSKQGGFFGVTWNNLLSQTGSSVSGANSILLNALIALDPPKPREGETQDQANNRLRRTMREGMRGALVDMAGDEDTTKEYIAEMQEGFLGGSWLAATGTVPLALLGPGGLGLMSSAADNVMQEMEGEEFANIPEWKKMLFASSVGVVVGQLEKAGIQQAVGGGKLARGIMANVFTKLPQNATTQQLRAFIAAETNSAIANAGSRLGGAMLSEAATELQQGVIEPTLKDLFNAAEAKNLIDTDRDGQKGFDTPASLSDLVSEAMYQAAQGAIGGAIFGTPNAVKSFIKDNKVGATANNTQFKMTEELLKDPEFEAAFTDQLKAQVESARISETQAKETIAVWKEAQQIVAKIPEDMQVEKRREAFDLLSEKSKLSKLDKSLVGDRIAKIDEKLAKLAGVPVEEQAAVPKKEEAAKPEAVAEAKLITQDDSANVISGSGVSEASFEEFSNVLESARSKMSPMERGSVSSIPPDFSGRVFLSDDGNAGFGISSSGELVGLFRTADGPRGFASKAIDLGRRLGATHLWAFEGGLSDLYKKYGAKEQERIAWNDEYATEGWNKETMGTPDVVRMSIIEEPADSPVRLEATPEIDADLDPDLEVSIGEAVDEDPDTILGVKPKAAEQRAAGEVSTGKKLTDKVISRAKKALRNIDSRVDVIAPATQEEYSARVQEIGRDGVESSWGIYDPRNGKIYVNPSGPDLKQTLFHETAHPVLIALAKSNPDKFVGFVGEIIEESKGKYDKWSKANYPEVDDLQRSMEAMAEFMGDVAAGRVPVSTAPNSLWQKLKRFFQDILASLGIDTRSVDLSKPETMRAFAAEYKRAVDKGIKITGLGKVGEQDGGASLQQDAERLVDGWYSRLRETAIAKGNTMPASQWMTWMEARAKEGAISMEEAKWTGLSDWLASKGNEKVTPQQVREFLNENRVRVEVKELSDQQWSPRMDKAQKAFENVGIDFYISDEGTRFFRDKNGDEIDPGDFNKRQRAVYDEFLTGGEGIPTKFSQYQLPGGTNYREVLVTLPLTKLPQGYVVRQEADGKWQVFDETTPQARALGSYLNDSPATTRERAIQMALDELSRSKENLFTSSHFDEPNILVHLRLNDRTGSNGEKILFIEELQSDFGQSLRKLEATIDQNFDDIVEKMKADGVLKKRCP